MGTLKMSSKGQVVIPKSVRESLHCQRGALFTIRVVGNEIRLTPSVVSKQTTVEAVGGMLQRHGRKRLSDAELERRILEQLRSDDERTKAR